MMLSSPPTRLNRSMSMPGMEEFFTPITRGFLRISLNSAGLSATPASWGML